MFRVSSRIAAGAALACAILAGTATPALAGTAAASPPGYAGFGRDVTVNLDEFQDGDEYGNNANVTKIPVSIISSYDSSHTIGFYGTGPEFSGAFGG
ncbi:MULTISPECIES: hypothetical protein [Actinoalloteichus]|uniref:Uncharacterized protein n=1 Tax=Actinoalloteichus fjordicus TaxID=1612552 RepID=A0AAC9L7P9_9PSEU|nr:MULTISPECIES: hypothetical protein [Actinoalloteichus]APU12642.1 hypothetical protein UA74_02775 [Actinoalloteichus fjordicus]APU18595.1 hypothetical protein UA75_02780 [Actinoalloteichus sp. GBA129-24]